MENEANNLQKNNTERGDKNFFEYDITIIGGLGHVGLPIGLVFANKDLRVCLYDIDVKKIEKVRNGEMPFIEYGAESLLKKVLENKSLIISQKREDIGKARYVIIAIGTPMDEYLNPKTRQFLETIESFKPSFNQEQCLIVRSTVYPNTCEQMLHILEKENNNKWKIAYCPERIVQGYAVKELEELPQIISGLTPEAVESASRLFGIISPKIIKMPIKEAELVKLFSNAWRYIQFAITNQFYMTSYRFGADYEKIRKAMTEGYGRVVNLPSPGFAAGPCLLKDTMQLVSFDSQNFILGQVSMMINEGLPNFIVETLKNKHNLKEKKVGILGMAFKADIDDVRDSLSYKLGKILRFNGSTVYYSDEFAKNPDFISKEDLIQKSDIVIIGVPHKQYKNLYIPKNVEVVDLWRITKNDNYHSTINLE